MLLSVAIKNYSPPYHCNDALNRRTEISSLTGREILLDS